MWSLEDEYMAQAICLAAYTLPAEQMWFGAKRANAAGTDESATKRDAAASAPSKKRKTQESQPCSAIWKREGATHEKLQTIGCESAKRHLEYVREFTGDYFVSHVLRVRAAIASSLILASQ